MANLGLGVNLENELLRNPTVVDFLISTTFAAAAANNKYTRFPFEDGAEEVWYIYPTTTTITKQQQQQQ